MTKHIKKIINFLLAPNSVAVMIFIGTLFLLTGLLSSRYFMFQNIIIDGISKKDIVATKNIMVVDTEKTEKRKSEVAEKIQPILTPAHDAINDYVNKSFGELITSIKELRNSKINNIQKKENLKELLGIPKDNYADNAAVGYLYRTSDKNFGKVTEESKASLNKILQKGVSEEDLLENNNKIITKNINSSLSRTQQQAIALLVKKVILPNMVVDDVATDIATKNAVNSVRPILVEFKAGEKIVSNGELVTKPQKDALRKIGYNVYQLDPLSFFGIMGLVGICLLCVAFYLINFDPKYLSASFLSLMSLLAVSIVIFAVFLPTNIPVYIIPIPAVAILLTIFINPRISLLFTILIIIMLGISMQYSIEAITVFMIGALASGFTSSMINYYRRMDLVKAGFYVGAVQALMIFTTYMLLSSSQNYAPVSIAADIILGFVNGLISGIIALGTLPLIESAFKIITPYGLIELTDHNQELLRRLQFEAPGTYHHSLMVSNLCEAASEAIGANPVLARVGAFYHDIGKLKRPLFFVENQSYFGIENPHEKLNPRLSKMVITAHPKDGLDLAKEYKLPSQIHQFINQHHGDSLAKFFYVKALQEEGSENVTEEQFRYTCPKPTTKEIAILMIADAVESAVRSLKNPEPQEVDAMIEKLINDRLIDGQLSESTLTLKDLKVISTTFKRILRGMQHHRIKYHENVLQELGQKTSMINAHLIQAAKKIEKDLVKESQEENKNA